MKHERNPDVFKKILKSLLEADVRNTELEPENMESMIRGLGATKSIADIIRWCQAEGLHANFVMQFLLQASGFTQHQLYAEGMNELIWE